jgi:thymidylate synthase
MISLRVKTQSLGRTWIDLVEQIVREGTPMGDEGLELLGRTFQFPAATLPDDVLERFADREMVQEMQKVFFSEGPNSLGHSYAKVICGPGGRHDLQDVIDLLKREPATKRALITFASQPGGKVPCITALQFLIRDEALQLIYFARGQDVFRKFYADALCLCRIGDRVATALSVPLGVVRGFIGSSHIYHRDMDVIYKTIAAVKQYTAAQLAEGPLV